MNLPLWSKIVIGIVTILPFLILIIAFTYMFGAMGGIMFSTEPINPFIFLSYIEYIGPVFAGFLLFYFTIGLFYLVHMISNKDIDTEKKLLWIRVLFVLNGLCLPFYWYLHIWNKPIDFNSIHSYHDDAHL